ncbi:MAG: zinc-binding dehydrogenase [Acidobacteria bacterium]|nr:zinc-binding dehydrogenase [Acidobacteriota bacterium]
MKAIIYYEFGDVDVLGYEDVPLPKIDDDEVLVRVRSVSLNHLDHLQRKGPAWLPAFSLPHIAGMDVAGDVERVGCQVTTLKPGDRVLINPSINCKHCSWCVRGRENYCPSLKVLGGNVHGGFAEYAKAPASHVYRLSDRLSYNVAACIPTVYVTAWHALIDRGRLRIGEDVLIHAAGSGVGTAAIQIAKSCGVRVIATAGSDAKVRKALNLGADVAINYNREDVVGVVKEVTCGKGVEMVLEHIGPATWERSLQSLAPRGRLVHCGATTGVTVQINLPYTYHFGINIIGSDGFTNAEFEEVLSLFNQGRFQPVIDTIYPLEQAARAQRRMADRNLFGKILMHPDGTGHSL